jgi:hypothetical protein
MSEWQPKERWVWFKDHGSLVVSLSVSLLSLVVAGLSVIYTINAQKIEREYKEFMIEPNLHYYIDNRDFSIVIENRGLGPALLTRVAVELDGECHVSTLATHTSREADQEWNSLANKFSQTFVASLVDKTFTPDKGILEVDSFTEWPSAGDIVGVNSKVYLLRFPPESLARISAEVDKLDVVHRTERRNQYLKMATNLPFHIDYCSMTQKFCRPRSRPSPCAPASPDD